MSTKQQKTKKWRKLSHVFHLEENGRVGSLLDTGQQPRRFPPPPPCRSSPRLAHSVVVSRHNLPTQTPHRVWGFFRHVVDFSIASKTTKFRSTSKIVDKYVTVWYTIKLRMNPTCSKENSEPAQIEPLSPQISSGLRLEVGADAKWRMTTTTATAGKGNRGGCSYFGAAGGAHSLDRR